MRTWNHRARAIVAALAASLSLMTVIGPAAASTTPQRVTIVSDMTVRNNGEGDVNDGTFTTRGSALICGAGVVDDTRLVYISGPNASPYVLVVDKTFICDDETGTIYLRLLGRGTAGVETFTWVMLGGTWKYVDRFGLGNGSTVPIGGGVKNTYTGYIVH